MDLKITTLLALLGSIILVLTNSFYFINSLVQSWRILGVPGFIPNFLNVLGSLLIMFFFIALYQKQE